MDPSIAEAFRILDVPAPKFAKNEIAELACSHFGVTPQNIEAVKVLGSEKDQNFKVVLRPTASEPNAPEYARSMLIKITNSAEDPEETDMQTSAMQHIKRVDPEYPVPAVIVSTSGLSQTWVTAKDGRKHILRAMSFLPGVTGETVYHDIDPLVRSELLKNLGRSLARLGRNMRGYFHQKAKRVILWDIPHVTQLRSLLAQIKSDEQREFFRGWLDNFHSNVLPVLPSLRSQIIMNDFNMDNVLVDPALPSRISGVLDFGDMVHTPLICDMAIAIGSVISYTPDPIKTIVDYLEGYTSVTALELEELEVLVDLIEARLVAFLLIANWRSTIHPDNATYILAGSEQMWPTLLKLNKELKRSDIMHAILTAPGITTVLPAPPSESTIAGKANFLPWHDEDDEEKLLARRAKALGPVYRLFYDKPLHFVRGRGIWLYDKEGRAYLDCYNNVPHIGHCHPYVTKILYHQATALNTHTRYLHQHVINYAERLVKTLPKSCSDLTFCMFACTGSEANDLAIRIARAYTGNEGLICSENAYHGSTLLTSQISPEVETENEKAHYQNFDPSHKTIRNLPTYVKTFPPPNTYERRIGRPRNGQKPSEVDYKSVDDSTFFAKFVDKAIDDLAKDGHKPAAVIIDPIFSSDGLTEPPEGFLSKVAERVRAAGGVYIADEVQSGMGRTGDALWGFENHGLIPDIITLGKPIGNGHPLAVVITSQRVVQNFANSTQYFNTFGGNPVSCAVGLAVLDVMEKENLQGNAKIVGDHFRKRLEELKQRFQCIGDIRGRGLALGIELVLDRKSHKPTEELASKVVNGLARERILVSATGRFSNVLKVRPPIVFSLENAELFVQKLEKVLKKEYLHEDIQYGDRVAKL